MADAERVIQLPYRGAPQTVAVIRQAALASQKHYGVRQLAELACERLASKDYLSEILAILNLISARTRYMRDPRTVELVRAPHLVAKGIAGGRIPSLDCDDMSASLAALLLSVGCEVRAVTVAFQHLHYMGQRQYTHVFVEAKEPKSGTWIACDPVAGEKTGEMLRRAVAAKTWPIA